MSAKKDNKQYMREYYARNRARLLQQKKEYWEKNKEEIKKRREGYWADYKKRNEEKVRQSNQRWYNHSGKKKRIEWREKNPDAYKAKRRAEYLARRDLLLECLKQLRKSDPSRFKLVRDKYYALNSWKVLEKNRRWAKTEKGRLVKNLMKRKYMAKKKSCVHVFSNDEWVRKVKETQGVCPRCKVECGVKGLTLDHVLPISRAPVGFEYTINDVQPLCHSCNSRKGNRLEVCVR